MLSGCYYTSSYPSSLTVLDLSNFKTSTSVHVHTHTRESANGTIFLVFPLIHFYITKDSLHNFHSRVKRFIIEFVQEKIIIIASYRNGLLFHETRNVKSMFFLCHLSVIFRLLFSPLFQKKSQGHGFLY